MKKRKPGGQPGHKGKTRKGFAKIDRIEILHPSICSHCGQEEFLAKPLKVDLKQVAQLVEKPIAVVEYHRHHCQCSNCGEVTSGSWPSEMIPGQDLGVRLQAFQRMDRKLWASSLRKTTRNVMGVRKNFNRDRNDSSH